MKVKNEQLELGLKSQQNMIYKLQQQVKQKNEQIIELNNVKNEYMIVRQEKEEMHQKHKHFIEGIQLQMREQQEQNKENKMNIITVENLKGKIQEQEKKLNYLEICNSQQNLKVNQLTKVNDDLKEQNLKLRQELNKNQRKAQVIKVQAEDLNNKLDQAENDRLDIRNMFQKEQAKMQEMQVMLKQEALKQEKELKLGLEEQRKKIYEMSQRHNDQLEEKKDRMNDLIKYNEELKEQLLKFQLMETNMHQKIEKLEYHNKLKSAEEVRLRVEKKQKDWEQRKIEGMYKLGQQLKEQRVRLKQQNESLNSNISRIIENMDEQSIYVDRRSSVSQLSQQIVTDSNVSETSYIDVDIDKQSGLSRQDYQYINRKLEGELEVEIQKIELLQKILDKQTKKGEKLDESIQQLRQQGQEMSVDESIVDDRQSEQYDKISIRDEQQNQQNLQIIEDMAKSRNFDEKVSDISRELSEMKVDNKELSLRNEKMASNISSLMMQVEDNIYDLNSDISVVQSRS